MRKMVVILIVAAALAIAAACAPTAGPFVRDISIQGGNLVLVKCMVEIRDERLVEGACTREVRPLPVTKEDRLPEDHPPPPAATGEAAPRPPG